MHKHQQIINYTEAEWALAWEYIKVNGGLEKMFNANECLISRENLSKFLSENSSIGEKLSITTDGINHSFLLVSPEKLAVMCRKEVSSNHNDEICNEKELGRGLYGTVYPIITRTILQNEDVIMAVKEMKPTGTIDVYIERCKEEAAILNKLDRDASVSMQNKGQNYPQIYIVQKFIEGTTLYDFWENNKDNLTSLQKINIVQEIIKGVQEYKSKEIEHNDLNMYNIMISTVDTEQNKYRVTIIDFGYVEYAGYYAPRLFNIMNEMVYKLAPKTKHHMGDLKYLELAYKEAKKQACDMLVDGDSVSLVLFNGTKTEYTNKEIEDAYLSKVLAMLNDMAIEEKKKIDVRCDASAVEQVNYLPFFSSSKEAIKNNESLVSKPLIKPGFINERGKKGLFC